MLLLTDHAIFENNLVSGIGFLQVQEHFVDVLGFDGLEHIVELVDGLRHLKVYFIYSELILVSLLLSGNC